MKYFHKLFAAVANSQISRVNIGRQMSTSQGISSKIEQAIREHFQPKHLEVLDVSGGCGQSFNVLIVSDKFTGKSTLQRHRLVNDALKSEISQLHAFSQKCMTPEQWNKD